MEKPAKPKIMLVEDNESLAKSMQNMFNILGYDCHLVHDLYSEIILSKLEDETRKFQPELAIVDGLKGNHYTAIEIIERAKPGVECLIFSADNEMQLKAKIPAEKDYRIFDKYHPIEKLVDYIKQKYPANP